MLLFSNLNTIFFGYFDPENIFLQIINIIDFRGDLTDISAKKEALAGTNVLENAFFKSEQLWCYLSLLSSDFVFKI